MKLEKKLLVQCIATFLACVLAMTGGNETLVLRDSRGGFADA